MKQSCGFPMGGHSSREILDTILLASEFRILSVIPNCSVYQRMVDDISAIFFCDLDIVYSNLVIMAKNYSGCMPLNIQISFGYSRFLDMSIIKLLQDDSSSHIIHTFLCFKELSQFDYVPFNSNVALQYKGCIVPSFIHRASTLCSLSSSRAHNYSLLLKLLTCRGQDMDIIHIKFKKAIVSLLHKRAKVFDGQCRDIAVVTDDESTQVHKMLEKIILRSYGSISRSAPSIIYKSLPQGYANIVFQKEGYSTYSFLFRAST
jgi:hypothetical protein